MSNTDAGGLPPDEGYPGHADLPDGSTSGGLAGGDPGAEHARPVPHRVIGTPSPAQAGSMLGETEREAQPAVVRELPADPPDLRRAKRAEHVVAACFIVSMLGGIGFIAAYLIFQVGSVTKVLHSTLGLGVTASVVSQNGSNYLSLTAVGATSLQLFDGPNSTGTDLLTNTGTGTEQTNTGYADPASTQVSTGTLTLVSGSQTQTFQLASNNLVAVKNAINALNAGVTATILTPSGTASYLSVSANNTGATHLQLYDGTSASGTDLLTGARYNWGESNYVRLDPQIEPAHILRVELRL